MDDLKNAGTQLAHIKPDHYHGADPERLPEPGSWWRMNAFTSTDPDDATGAKLAEITTKTLGRTWDEGQVMPEHGLVLLLTDARYIDGELHSLVLAAHPGWAHQDAVKLTRAQFAMVMSEEPDGAMLREREKARAMGRLQHLHEDIGAPPTEDDVARRVTMKKEAAVEAEKKSAARTLEHDRRANTARGEATRQEAPGREAPDYARLVPVALLPSQDIVRAEAMIQHQIMTAEATREIIEERIARASKSMSIVSRYQQEVVATALAGISQQRQFADKMLTSVHTMKLWLGDGVEVFPVLDGKGAPADAPVHFMQQLLYLDEEIHTADVMDQGFNADHLNDLPKMLSENPEIVSTMLPHPRCVVLARVRRHHREMQMDMDIRKLFAMIQAQKLDETILIFARDGERLSVIQADDETSRAKRLFPSRHEIDGIFVAKGWNEPDAGKVIDVSDVRYAEKRADHDNVALFYKRFLLILWGAHERAEIFGTLPKGMNWLTDTTHDKNFRFVHDEEFGLDGVSRPPVREWIRARQAEMRPGSRAVVRWNEMLTSDDAPGAWNRPEHHQPSQIRKPLEARSIVTVTETGGELFVSCQCRKMHDWRDESRTYTVNVRLARNAVKPISNHDDVFVIDHMTSAEIEGYLQSRKERQSYLRWMAELKLALPEIRSRERCEEVLRNRILANYPKLDPTVRAQLDTCAHEAVLAADWSIPPLVGDAGIVAQARILAQGLPEDDEALSRAVRGNGAVVRNMVAPMLFGGLIEEPFVNQQVCALKRDGTLSVRSERFLPAWSAVQPGDIPVGEDMSGFAGSQKLRFRIPSIADRSWMAGVLENGDAVNDFLDRLLAPSSEDAAAWVSETIQLTNKKGKGKILYKDAPHTIGFAVVPPLEDPGRRGGDGWSLRMIRLESDLVRHAWTAGYRDEARVFSRIFADPGAMEKRFIQHQDRPTVRVLLEDVGSSRSWRQAGEATPEYAGGIAAGYRDLNVSFYGWAKEREANFRFAKPDLRTALLRPLLQSREHVISRLDNDALAGWTERQREGIRIFLPEGVEGRLVKMIGTFEPLPASGPEAEMPVFGG